MSVRNKSRVAKSGDPALNKGYGPAPRHNLLVDDTVRITPSWLTVEHHSYTIEGIVKVRRIYSEPPRSTAAMVAVIAVILAMVSGFHLARDQMPMLLGWLMLLSSVFLALWALWVVLVQQGRYRVQISFRDGDQITIGRKRMSQAEDIFMALHDAMDWQRHRTLSVHPQPGSYSDVLEQVDDSLDLSADTLVYDTVELDDDTRADSTASLSLADSPEDVALANETGPDVVAQDPVSSAVNEAMRLSETHVDTPRKAPLPNKASLAKAQKEARDKARQVRVGRPSPIAEPSPWWKFKGLSSRKADTSSTDSVTIRRGSTARKGQDKPSSSDQAETKRSGIKWLALLARDRSRSR